MIVHGLSVAPVEVAPEPQCASFRYEKWIRQQALPGVEMPVEIAGVWPKWRRGRRTAGRLSSQWRNAPARQLIAAKAGVLACMGPDRRAATEAGHPVGVRASPYGAT